MNATVLDKMAADQKQRIAAGKQKIGEIALKLAKNITVPEAEIQEALEQSGMTFEDIKKKIERCRRHFTRVDKLAGLEKQCVGRKEVSAEYVKVEAEFIKVKADYQERLRSLEAKRSSFNSIQEQIEKLRNELKANASESQRLEHSEAKEQLRSFAAAMNRHRETAAKCEGELPSARAKTERLSRGFVATPTCDLAALRVIKFTDLDGQQIFEDFKDAMKQQERLETALKEAEEGFVTASERFELQLEVVREIERDFCLLDLS